MRKIFLGISIILLGLQAIAQDVHVSSRSSHIRGKKSHPPVVYINVSTGINNNTGLLGASVEVPFAKHFSAEGGVGISSWGTKFTASGKYYLHDYRTGWAFGAGVTHNTGISNYNTNLPTVYGDNEDVTLQLHPQTNIFAAAYKYWRLGRHGNRIYLELGWSVPVTSGDKYDETYGAPLSDNANSTMNLLSPGGLIVGFGFSFGIY